MISNKITISENQNLQKLDILNLITLIISRILKKKRTLI